VSNVLDQKLLFEVAVEMLKAHRIANKTWLPEEIASGAIRDAAAFLLEFDEKLKTSKPQPATLLPDDIINV